MIFTLTKLETQPWETQSGASINPVPADEFTAALNPSGVLKVSNTSLKAMGGALVTCKPALPVGINTLDFPFFGLDLDVYVPPWILPNLGRLELDVKRWIVGAPAGKQIANIANGSTQWNRSRTQWQIDGNPPGWLDTGFEPVLPSCWTTLKFRHYMGNTTYSVLSTMWGDIEFSVPSAMQAVPLQQSDWGPGPGIAIQVQTEVLQPGTVPIYLQNITLMLSDKAIA